MTAVAAKVDPSKASLLQEYKHNRPLTSCHWDPAARFVFFGAEDNLVHRYDLKSNQAAPLAGHDSWVRAFGSSPNGKVLYTGGYDGRIIFWPADVEKPSPAKTFSAHDGWVRALAVSHDGQRIASCGNDRLVKLWNAADGALVREFKGHENHVYNVAFSNDSTELISCDLKGVVRRWNTDGDTTREPLTIKSLHGYDTTFRADVGGARGIAVHSGGGQLALSGITNVTNAFAGVGEVVVALVDLAGHKAGRVLQTKDKIKGAAWGVAHHPDGFWIGLSGGGGGGWLCFWKGDEDHEFFKLKLKNDGRGLSVAPDQRQLAVAHADMHLRTYALYQQ
ncbi:MAG: hypothetical protein QGG36_06370 [Pirellulaceae bacterium]|nr:hypothetical protein [Pirellulaceae bacterium]MDP7015403.1 hypothetical protein [Pirellulaceae bacterium]